MNAKSIYASGCCLVVLSLLAQFSWAMTTAQEVERSEADDVFAETPPEVASTVDDKLVDALMYPTTVELPKDIPTVEYPRVKYPRATEKDGSPLPKVILPQVNYLSAHYSGWQDCLKAVQHRNLDDWKPLPANASQSSALDDYYHRGEADGFSACLANIKKLQESGEQLPNILAAAKQAYIPLLNERKPRRSSLHNEESKFAPDGERSSTVKTTPERKITSREAEEMILSFLDTAEVARENEWIQASRSLIQDRHMETSAGDYVWGPWQVDPARRTVALQTDLSGPFAYARRLDGKIVLVGEAYEIQRVTITRIYRR